MSGGSSGKQVLRWSQPRQTAEKLPPVCPLLWGTGPGHFCSQEQSLLQSSLWDYLDFIKSELWSEALLLRDPEGTEADAVVKQRSALPANEPGSKTRFHCHLHSIAFASKMGCQACFGGIRMKNKQYFSF